MPHIQIDYSRNLEARLDVAGLCRVLRDAAAQTGILPLAVQAALVARKRAEGVASSAGRSA